MHNKNNKKGQSLAQPIAPARIFIVVCCQILKIGAPWRGCMAAKPRLTDRHKTWPNLLYGCTAQFIFGVAIAWVRRDPTPTTQIKKKV